MVYPGRPKPKYPNINLTSAAIRETLTRHLVLPAVERHARVIPFRLVWRGLDHELADVWGNIVALRERVDAMVRQVDGISFFVSSVTGTVSIHVRKQDQPTDIFPALAYWVVGEGPQFNESALMTTVMNNGLGATFRQMAQRKTKVGTEGAADRGAATLYMVVKDHGEGFVRGKIDESLGTDCKGLHPIVKFIVHERAYMPNLQMAQARLKMSNFHAVIENY